MPSRLLLAAVLIAAFAARDASARIVYKCTNAHGDIAFQDKACAKGDHEMAIDVGTPPPPPPPAPAAVPVAVAPAAPPPPPESPPRKPLPQLWMCTRAEDGSQYVSQNGSPPSRLVPAGILGYPPQSLTQVYGPGGNKATAPGAGRNALAGDYVEVRDACAPASPAQTCTYLRGELNAVDKKLHNAFKDDRAVLEPRQQELRDDLDGC
ncbi:MAG: DUF4124 domain-containing protein [Rudaea sp.]